MAKYLYQRGENFHFQFRWPADCVHELCMLSAANRPLERFSLHTTDRALAEAEAERFAADRKHMIAWWRSYRRAKLTRTPVMTRKMEPNTTAQNDDGTYTIATEQFLVTMRIDEMGRPVQVGDPVPNAMIQIGTRNNWVFASKSDELASLAAAQHRRDHMGCRMDPGMSRELEIDRSLPLRPEPKAAKGEARDNAILDFWVDNNGIRDADAGDARAALEQLKKMFPGATLETATFTQAMALGRYYFRGFGDDPGPRNAPVTAQKKVRWLSTAMREGKKMTPPVVVNPFEGVVVKPRPGDNYEAPGKRLPFDDGDAQRFVNAIPHMAREHQILAMMVLSTGMRPAEVLAIREEEVVAGIRCVTVGAKIGGNQDRKRTVPLPKIVLDRGVSWPLFPAAPFADTEKMKTYAVKLSNKMNAYVRGCGITDKRKVFYSLRHRAITTLTNKSCPIEIALEIVGHEEHNGVHRGYIYGQSAYPREVLRGWIGAITEDLDFSMVQ